jgi:hypothetical protein
MGLDGMLAGMLSNDTHFLPDTACCEQSHYPIFWFIAPDHLFVGEGF